MTDTPKTGEQRRREQKAWSHLQFGHFRPRIGNPWVRCPDCRRHVTADRFGLFTERQVEDALILALARHFGEDCPDERNQP